MTGGLSNAEAQNGYFLKEVLRLLYSRVNTPCPPQPKHAARRPAAPQKPAWCFFQFSNPQPLGSHRTTANPKNETRARAVQRKNSASPRSSGPTRGDDQEKVLLRDSWAAESLGAQPGGSRVPACTSTRSPGVTCGKSPLLPLPTPPSRHSSASVKSARAGAPEIRHGNAGCA